MSIFKSSLLAGLCLAAFACHKTPAGSKNSSGSDVDGTGHTGAVAPANGTAGDPNVAPGGAPSDPSTASPTSARTTGGSGGAMPPSGTGNSNTDMGNPASGTGSGGSGTTGGTPSAGSNMAGSGGSGAR